MLRDRGMKSVVHENPISVRLPSSEKMWGSPNRQKAKALKHSTRSCGGVGAGVEPRMLARLRPPHAAHAAPTRHHGYLEACATEGRCHSWERARLSGHVCDDRAPFVACRGGSVFSGPAAEQVLRVPPLGQLPAG